MNSGFNCFLEKEDYTWANALLWGNFIGHAKKIREGSLGDRIVHALIAISESIPIIGQIASIAEKLIVNIYYNFQSSQPLNGRKATAVTVDMIKSFSDIDKFCMESYPCQHGRFEVELKDGRKVVSNLSSIDVYSILNGLKENGVQHKDWNHFSCYKDFKTVRPPKDILTQIFDNSI